MMDSSVYQHELGQISDFAHQRVDRVLKDMLEQLFISSPDDPITVCDIGKLFLEV